MSKKCSICGCEYEVFSFKSGFVCESCLHSIKSDFASDARVRVKD